MFGQNPIRKASDFPDGLLRVQQVFYTIQGEGPFAGYPAVFVRTAGCNLRCTFCDTDFESGWANVMSPEDLFGLVGRTWAGGGRQGSSGLVVLTGGEPLIQNPGALARLVELLTTLGWHVQVETAGTVGIPAGGYAIQSVEGLPEPGHVSFVVSPKTPRINYVVAYNALAFKYIVSKDDEDPDDGLPVLSTQGADRHHRLARPPRHMSHLPLYVQPKDVPDSVARADNVAHAARLSLRYGYRLSLQLHKIVGLE